MKFCPDCASVLSLRVPKDDTKVRHVCPNCDAIHYQNPKIIVGTIPIWEQDQRPKVLLCKRAIEPRRGYWTLPAGFMENGEAASFGAQRETIEEAGAAIELQRLFALLDVVHANQVHLFYLAKLINLNYKAGKESLDVRLLGESEIPWDNIAFSTVSIALKFFFKNYEDYRNTGKFVLLEQTVDRRNGT